MITIFVLSAISFVALMGYSTIGVVTWHLFADKIYDHCTAPNHKEHRPAPGVRYSSCSMHFWTIVAAIFWPAYLSLQLIAPSARLTFFAPSKIGSTLAAKIRRETKKTIPDHEFIAQAERELGLVDE